MLFSAHDFLQSIWEIAVSTLMAIPSTFYGIIIGAFFSILGIHLSNSLRLKSERDLRLFDEKRESYAECLEGAQSAIALIADSAKTQKTEDEFINAADTIRGKFSKHALLGSAEALDRINKFSVLFGSEYAKFSLLRLKCRIYIQGAIVSRDIAASARARQQKMLDMQREMNLSGVTDASKWDMVQSMFEDEAKMVDDWTKDAVDNDRKNLRQQIKILRDILESLPKFSDPYIELLSCIRNDLNIEFDRKEVETTTIKTMKESKTVILNFIEELEEIIKNDFHSEG